MKKKISMLIMFMLVLTSFFVTTVSANPNIWLEVGGSFEGKRYVEMSWTLTVHDGTPPYRYGGSFGDGPTAWATLPIYDNPYTISHTYLEDGEYNWFAHVKDADGDTAMVEAIVTIAGNTLYVGGSGPNNYTSIQEAINDAETGDYVFVYDDSSPYWENVVVDKSIDLIGENKETTVIDGGNDDSVIEVYADHVYIEGFYITDGGPFLTLAEAGVNVFSDRNTIRNNIIEDNYCNGIRLFGSNHNLIENNILKDNYDSHIKIMDESYYNNVRYNILTEVDYDFWFCQGIRLWGAFYNTIEYNEIFEMDVRAFTLEGLSYKRCENNTIRKNIISDGLTDGSEFYLINADYNYIEDNEIRNCKGSGIGIYSSTGNEIIGNTIEFLPGLGIYLVDCAYIVAKFNNISYVEQGMRITVYSSKSIIESNNLINNNYGIHLSGTDLMGFVPNNKIYHNHFAGNNYGIYITVHENYGPANDNLIYHNNFIENGQSAYDECNNIWDDDYPSGGNYWYEYTGPDWNGDGIGDIPYPIPGGDNEDRYPLMKSKIDTDPPEMTNVHHGKITYTFEEEIFMTGDNIPISADVSDDFTGVDLVKVNITYPDQTWGNFTMTHVGGDTYRYVFSDTEQSGLYRYMIWAVDKGRHSNTSKEHSFTVYRQVEETFYFNHYNDMEAWEIFPEFMVDGEIGTFAHTLELGRVEWCDDNNVIFPPSISIITKVELRAFAYRGRFWCTMALRPVFRGVLDGDDHVFDPGTNLAWSQYFDITNDRNAPETWTWQDVDALDCDVEAFEGEIDLSCSMVEIRVTYLTV